MIFRENEKPIQKDHLLPMKKAIVLVSGGLDSTTMLALAKSQGYQCHTLSFNYGQRHVVELRAVRAIVDLEKHKTINMDLTQIGGSALTDRSISIPELPTAGIPITYVPARNTIFLSYALAWAEVLDIDNIFIGVNAVDYSGYPDCRPVYIHAFEQMAELARKPTDDSRKICIHTPLINLKKSEIIQLGITLGVEYALTISCYQASDNGEACATCDSCRLRKQGFEEAGVADPTHYKKLSKVKKTKQV